MSSSTHGADTFSKARHMCEYEDNCAICLSTPFDLCYLECGHGFCRECLDNWTAHSGKQECPTCREPLYFSFWYSVIDAGLSFLRVHCTYDVFSCFHWWSILHFHAVIMVWAIRIGECKQAMFLSNNILIVYVSARLLRELFKVGFLGRVAIELVLCAGTPCLWVRLSCFRMGALLVAWNMVLVCYKLFVQQDLSTCGVLLLFVVSVMEARCRWYHTRGVMQYYRQMS